MPFNEIFDPVWQKVILRFFLNFAMVFILARWLYYPRREGTKDFLFTYLSVSVIIFLICIILSQVPVELGFALGLFAVFSVIHFRSIQVSPRELSYLFITLGLAILNALALPETPILRLFANNLLILIVMGVSDLLLFRKKPLEKIILYDRLDLLPEEKRNELEQDLLNRFGISHIKHIQIGNIDALKNRVKLKVFIDDVKNRHFLEI